MSKVKHPQPQTIQRPPTVHGGVVRDPADAPAMKRYQAILVLMRKGHSEERAIAIYDRPKGVCCDCNAPAEGRKKRCKACQYAVIMQRCRRYRQTEGFYVEVQCAVAGCTAKFKRSRTSGRKNCKEHAHVGKARPKKKPHERVVRHKQPKPAQKPKPVSKMTKPLTPPKPPADEKEYKIVVPESVQVTKLPPMFPTSRWD